MAGALALGVAAVGLLTASRAARPTADGFPLLPQALPAGKGVVRPCLSRLPGKVQCGRFRVYENRKTRSGRTLDLAFVVLRALNDRGHRDPLTRFYGGPGAAATPTASGLGRLDARVREERDILLVDHRGTGSSGALVCDDTYPGGIVSRFESVLPPDHAEVCRDRLAQRADLTQYTSPNAMDDLAELAAWLGYERLNLVGGSYGTREAQVFARRHPERVRTVVMDGAAPVHEPVYVHHARYLQDALETLLEECGADAACGAAHPDRRAALDAVLARASSDPAVVKAEGVRVRFGIGALTYALRGLLYRRPGTLLERIDEAQTGRWQRLADDYLARQSWVGASQGLVATGYHYSTLCAEDVGRLTWDEIARETRGTFMGDHLIRAYKRVCELWPYARLPDAYFQPVRSDAPALILSGSHDPVTPASSGEAVARFWPNSLHVVAPNRGHGQGGACVEEMVSRLVRTGTTEGIDTSCVGATPAERSPAGGTR